jgi:hypothetical protein
MDFTHLPGGHQQETVRLAMKSKLLWLIVAVAIILGYALYLSRASKSRLDVDPHAAEEIEKAKRR